MYFYTMHLFETITIRYNNPELKIGLQYIRNAWLLEEQPIKLSCALHQGNLFYRNLSHKRISYRSLKKALIKREIIIKQPVIYYLFKFQRVYSRFHHFNSVALLIAIPVETFQAIFLLPKVLL